MKIFALLTIFALAMIILGTTVGNFKFIESEQ